MARGPYADASSRADAALVECEAMLAAGVISAASALARAFMLGASFQRECDRVFAAAVSAPEADGDDAPFCRCGTCTPDDVTCVSRD